MMIKEVLPNPGRCLAVGSCVLFSRSRPNCNLFICNKFKTFNTNKNKMTKECKKKRKGDKEKKKSVKREM
jgi:hypothetical protein